MRTRLRDNALPPKAPNVNDITWEATSTYSEDILTGFLPHVSKRVASTVVEHISPFVSTSSPDFMFRGLKQLCDFFVAPGYRGKGIASKLIEEAVRRYHPDYLIVGASQNAVSPGFSDEALIAFYTRHGFHVVPDTHRSRTIMLYKGKKLPEANK